MAIREDLWDFPHDMQLKGMGAADAPLEDAVADILEQHVADFDRHAHLSSRPSTKGNFVSITASVTLRHREQVESIYRDLDACPHVKITL